MNNKQVGITKPLMVVSDLLTAITQGHPKLKFVVDLVNMLYGNMRDKFKVGKINEKDIEDTIALFPKYMKDQITNEKVLKKAELDIVFDRLIKHSELVSFQNENLNKHTSTKPTNILQIEKELSKENVFLINTDDMQLTHAGMFSTAVLPFIDPNMAERELLLSYLSHIPEAVAVFKLTNMRIMAQVDEEQAVNNNIVTFKTPSFLAMATTATVNNTDIVSLIVDLGTTGVVLNNDRKLKLGLDKIDISNLSALAENETAPLPNIRKGKEVIEKIIDKLIRNSLSDDDKAFYHEYKSASQAPIKQQHLSKDQQEQIRISIEKIIETASNLDFDTKNLVRNLKDTAEIINNKIFNDQNIDMQTENYVHHDLNTHNDKSDIRELENASTDKDLYTNFSESFTEPAQGPNSSVMSSVLGAVSLSSTIMPLISGNDKLIAQNANDDKELTTVDNDNTWDYSVFTILGFFTVCATILFLGTKYLNSEQQHAHIHEDQNNVSLSLREESNLLGEEAGDIV